MSIIHEDLEPGVIDTAMIMKALEEEKPAGEAGRLVDEEGIVLHEVIRLRLEFLNILKIDHLWMMTSLVKLQLGNNMIEKIEGLSFLANLKELDLSFNNIEIIENLEVLVKLEVLTLFENRINRLENMETLVNLMIFSIGNNQIEDRNDVIYLRQFSHLYSLNMAGNPCVCNGDRDFRVYICAFLPKLTYYEYHIISAEERAIAEGSYKDILQQLEETEEKKRQTREDAEARTMELAHHTEAFVENLDGDQLFSAMFTNDRHSKALFTMGDVVTDVYNKFHDEAMNVIHQLFKVGLEQHEIRQEEIRQYYTCVDAAKEKNTVSCQQYTENFLERKAEIFLNIRNILKAIQDLLDMEENATQVEYIARVQILSDQFNKECQTAWYELMAQELTLCEQLEEVNGSFQQNMTNLVSAFIKAAQSFFVQIRNLEASYSEEMSEVAHAYLTNLNAGTVPAVPELKQIMLNKESLNSATTQSHDTHIQVIDSREDELVTRIRKWVKSYCDQIATGEVQRSRQRVIEINHFLDIQREQFEELQTLLLNAVASLLPSEEQHSETEQKPGPQTADPQPLARDSKDALSTNAVLSKTSTIAATADTNSAVEPETKEEHIDPIFRIEEEAKQETSNLQPAY